MTQHPPRGIHDFSAVIDELGALRNKLEILPDTDAQLPTDSSDLLKVKEILRHRAARAKYFDATMFGEPAWDILLDLFVALLEKKNITISSACIASRVPATTALRWISKMSKDGLIYRTPDSLDSRRIWVSLSPNAANLVRRYLREVVRN